MIIYIDGDACPVTNEIISIADQKELQVKLVKSYAHFSFHQHGDHVEEIYVDSEDEAVDYRIMAMIDAGDLLITQDYGLASLALQKNCRVMHPRGFYYTQANINSLLTSRYQSAQIRRQGGKTKGPKPFTTKDRQKFSSAFKSALN